MATQKRQNVTYLFPAILVLPFRHCLVPVSSEDRCNISSPETVKPPSTNRKCRVFRFQTKSLASPKTGSSRRPRWGSVLLRRAQAEAARLLVAGLTAKVNCHVSMFEPPLLAAAGSAQPHTAVTCRAFINQRLSSADTSFSLRAHKRTPPERFRKFQSGTAFVVTRLAELKISRGGFPLKEKNKMFSFRKREQCCSWS